MDAITAQAVDLLITHAWIVTMDDRRRIYRDGGLALSGDRIVAVGPSDMVGQAVQARASISVALGRQFGALPFFVARYFGARAFGSIIGIIYSAVIAAQGITPILLDASFDAHHSYRQALIVAGACLAVGAMLLLLLPRYGRTGPMDAPVIVHGI